MSLSAQEKWELEEKALSLREKVLRMIKASGSGHLGGAPFCNRDTDGPLFSYNEGRPSAARLAGEGPLYPLCGT